MIPNFVNNFLLLNDSAVKDPLVQLNDGLASNTIACEKLVLDKIDNNILHHFIGYFYYRD